MSSGILVLDVNQTLSDLTPVGDVLDHHGAPRGLTQTWFAAVLRDGFALTVSARAPAFAGHARDVLLDLLHPLAARGELAVGADEVADAVMDRFAHLDVHPDVVPGLRAAHAAGHRVITLTNGTADYARDLLERAGVADVVEAFLGVEGLGVWKPHPEAYAVAVGHLGVEPAQLTLVAAHPWDVDGARAAGWSTVYVDRTGGPWPAAFAPAERTVTSLEQLA